MSIAAMPLYATIGRIRNELKELGAAGARSHQNLPDVRHTLYGVTMTDADQYARDVAAAGFSNIAVTDMSDDWAAFCAGRATAWHADADRHTRVHGERIFQTLDTFFTTVARMFASGRLGGVRIVASRVDRE